MRLGAAKLLENLDVKREQLLRMLESVQSGQEKKAKRKEIKTAVHWMLKPENKVKRDRTIKRMQAAARKVKSQ